MIYLIGGSSRSGKTTIARKLSEKLGVPWISIDSMRPLIKPYLSSENLPFDRLWADQDNDLLFNRYSSDTLVRASITEARALWPGVKGFIQHNILISQDYIIEGEQLLPELIVELQRENFWESVKVIYLVRLDENKALQDIKKNRTEHDWLTLHSTKEETLEKAAKMICTLGRVLQKGAEEYGFQALVVVLENSNMA